MRLWSVHPSHLDARGLVALWREALLAKKVLRGRTRGYRHHPQLARFRKHPQPVAAINAYLFVVLQEARRRGYSFDSTKVRGSRTTRRMTVTRGQRDYEWNHLMRKLKERAPSEHKAQLSARIRCHPLFQVRPGPVENWEVASGA